MHAPTPTAATADLYQAYRIEQVVEQLVDKIDCFVRKQYPSVGNTAVSVWHDPNRQSWIAQVSIVGELPIAEACGASELDACTQLLRTLHQSASSLLDGTAL